MKKYFNGKNEVLKTLIDTDPGFEIYFVRNPISGSAA